MTNRKNTARPDQPGIRSNGRWIGGAQLGLSSVETLVIPNRAAANSEFVN